VMLTEGIANLNASVTASRGVAKPGEPHSLGAQASCLQ
jgi:hypothetical protein